MPKLLLTEISVRSLKTPLNGQTDYWDAKTPGFGVRVGALRKTFIAKIANRRHTLGHYGAISLQEARKKVHALRASGDTTPLSKLTFSEAYERFKTHHVVRKKERTRHDYQRVLEKYFLPELATTRLSAITFERLTTITDTLADTPSEQAHTLAVARTFFKWCARPPRRYIPYSPLDGLQLPAPKRRKRILSDEELAAVWQAAERQGYPHGTVIQTLILTGQRKSEIGSLCRSWFNLRDQTITLPDWLTKNGVTHTFPYGDLLAHVMADIPRRNSTDYLFPSRYEDDRPFSGWSKFKTELNDGCAHWTLHDLRRTFRTGLGRLGVAPHIAERLVNHISARTDMEETYDLYTYLPEMRAAIEIWEAHIANVLSKAAPGNLIQVAQN